MSILTSFLTKRRSLFIKKVKKQVINHTVIKCGKPQGMSQVRYPLTPFPAGNLGSGTHLQQACHLFLGQPI